MSTATGGGPSRREEILTTLAQMLEADPGKRITTAALAKELGVSEAALYRHFPSKARMFEALLAFVEDSLFSRIPKIREQVEGAPEQCGQVLALLLLFAERNPGIATLLCGQGLIDDTARLRQQVRQLLSRIETELRSILREGERTQGTRLGASSNQIAAALLAQAEGLLSRFVHSGFEDAPTERWRAAWPILAAGAFPEWTATA